VRVYKAKRVIVLGQAEKALWQKQAADGRVVDATRRRVRAAAQALADDAGGTVEVYAPARAGGCQLDAVEPGEYSGPTKMTVVYDRGVFRRQAVRP
jgi:hypothetical protein